MSRKRQAPVREVLADPIFNSKLVTKLINTIMLKGKKSTAERILYSAFELVKEKTGQDPLEVFQKAVENKETPKTPDKKTSPEPTKTDKPEVKKTPKA